MKLHRACSVYWFTIFIINMKYAYVLAVSSTSRPVDFTLAQAKVHRKSQNLCNCFTSKVHDVHVLKNIQMGGSGLRHHEFVSIEAYVVSDVSDVHRKCNVRYINHVDDVGLLAYSSSTYIHTNMPLSSLFKLITLSNARKIAAVHGIYTSSHCTIAQLLMLTEHHSCTKCSSHISVFSSVLNMNQLSAKRSKKYRDKLQAGHTQAGSLITTINQSPQFPPAPASDNLEHLILTNACKKMLPDYFMEVGCAVCGELKPIRTMNRLKSMKNYLHILETQGVTHVERKSAAAPVKEYKGAVLDYSCKHICDTCRVSIRNGKVPRISLANNLWIGSVPEELSSLRYVEKILIARVSSTLHCPT